MNFFGIIILQFVGHLLSGSIVDNAAWSRAAEVRGPVTGAAHCWPVLLQVTNTQRYVWLNLCGATRSWCTKGFVWALRASLAGMRLDSKHNLPLLMSCWGFFFALGCKVSFFGGIQHSPVDGYSAASCNFGVLAEDESTSFYSSFYIWKL